MTARPVGARISAVPRRLFTPIQANQTLPLVRRIVADILGKARELRALGRVAGKERPVDRQTVTDLETEIAGLITELELLGCQYKDWGFEAGLVDFPSRLDGKRVLLCWRSDEDSVAHYHGEADGFAGRRPIPASLLGDEPLAEPSGDRHA